MFRGRCGRNLLTLFVVVVIPSQCLLTGTYKLKLILCVFMAYCFQTCKDHSAPQTTPEILFTPPQVDLPCVVDVFLIAEKAGVLLVKPSMSRLARSKAPPPLDLPLRLYVGINSSRVQNQKYTLCLYTERKPVNMVNVKSQIYKF